MVSYHGSVGIEELLYSREIVGPPCDEEVIQLRRKATEVLNAGGKQFNDSFSLIKEIPTMTEGNDEEVHFHQTILLVNMDEANILNKRL